MTNAQRVNHTYTLHALTIYTPISLRNADYLQLERKQHMEASGVLNISSFSLINSLEKQFFVIRTLSDSKLILSANQISAYIISLF